MCGIAGILNLKEREPVGERELRQMLALIRHRGPDEFGIYLDPKVGLGSARLSIIDLSGGQQPISNEAGTLWIVFNGEIFNYRELRSELQSRGHRFQTQTDTEVLLRLYEESGPDCLSRLNGQFAIAIWNAQEHSLFLARDRLGVRPLFYTVSRGRLIFGSEIKAILAEGSVCAEIDPGVLDQVFTFWSPLSPRTIFREINEVPPGHYLRACEGEIALSDYWQLRFPLAAATARDNPKASQECLDEFSNLLIDAAQIRLRADVPVGAYLSGGLDSSTICSLVCNYTTNRLATFSIAFSDRQYDERSYQRQMADFLGTEHQVVSVTDAEIGRVFPQVVWHTEVPLMRTAPAPMFLLSKLVQDSGLKVVLTGEGADEFLAGYDIFKEAKIRRFWARRPDSKRRPTLLNRLYGDIPDFAKTNNSFLSNFFREDLLQTDSPVYSHAVRWRNNRRSCRFFSDEARHSIGQQASKLIDEQLDRDFGKWDGLARAQYLEAKIFLSQYLLSSQGDRVAMAHAIEGRYPFLDYRVVEFCNRLPANLKLRGLTDKYLLRKLGQRWLPPEICCRPKRPYRAPIHRSFFTRPALDYVRELLSPARLKRSALFAPAAVTQLVRKIEEARPIGQTDDMALVGVISTELLHEQFVSGFRMPPPLSDIDKVKVCCPHRGGMTDKSQRTYPTFA